MLKIAFTHSLVISEASLFSSVLVPSENFCTMNSAIEEHQHLRACGPCAQLGSKVQETAMA